MTWKDGSACKPHEPMGEGLASGLECFGPILCSLLGPTSTSLEWMATPLHVLEIPGLEVGQWGHHR